MQFLKSFNRNKNKFFREIKKKALLSFLRTQPSRASLDINKVRKILLLRLDDKVGDMVVTTGTAYLLAKHGFRVSVLTGPVCGQMLKNCEYLDQVIQYKNRMSLDALHAHNFDVIIDFDDVNDYERLSLAWRMKHCHHIGFNKNIPALYHPSISYLNAEKHITERHKRVLTMFDIRNDEFRYHLGRCSAEENKVRSALVYTHGDVVVSINPFSGAPDKDFSEGQVIAIIRFIQSVNPAIKIVVIGHNAKVQPFSDYGAFIMSDSTINTAIEIVRISDVVVSTDTSIVHIANALNRSLVALYNKRKLKDTGMPGYKIWAPNFSLGKQIVVNEDHISQCSVATVFPAIEMAIRTAKLH